MFEHVILLNEKVHIYVPWIGSDLVASLLIFLCQLLIMEPWALSQDVYENIPFRHEYSKVSLNIAQIWLCSNCHLQEASLKVTEKIKLAVFLSKYIFYSIPEKFIVFWEGDWKIHGFYLFLNKFTCIGNISVSLKLISHRFF